MQLLRFFESIRNPFLDEIFLMITRFGEETVFIVIGIFLFWCVNKKHSYYILFVGFLGIVMNQFLKIFFRIPRPWIQDSSFTVVDGAMTEAAGYSFPSGHTQISVGAYGSIAMTTKSRALRILCAVLCVLVPLSRMYLGVHTLLDVGISTILALFLTFGFYPLVNRAWETKNGMRILMAAMAVASLSYLIYVEVFPFPSNTDPENLEEALSNAYKILGCISGVWLGYELDKRYINFETKAVWWAQLLKLLGGLIVVLAIKEGFKAPLRELLRGSAAADTIRYFLITAFACGIWPFTFGFFGRLGKKA